MTRRPPPCLARLGLLLAGGLALLAGALGPQAGCSRSPAGRLDVWAVPDDAEPLLTERTANPPPSADDTSVEPPAVQLLAARQETVSFRFAVAVAGGAVDRPTLQVRTWRDEWGTPADVPMSLYRLHRETVPPWPGWHVRTVPPAQREPEPFDVLVPLSAPQGGWPTRLRPGETLHLWADVEVPAALEPGVYHTRVEVLADDEAVQSFEVVLTVLPLLLPAEPAVPMIVELDHGLLFEHHQATAGLAGGMSLYDWRDHPAAADLDALLTGTMRQLRAHGLTPVVPSLAPLTRVGPDGEVQVDWSHYDAVVAGYLSGAAFDAGSPLEAWPLPLQPMFAVCAKGPDFPGPGNQGIVRDYAHQCVTHFVEQGWLDRAYGALPRLPIGTAAAPRSLSAYARALRAADPRLPVLARWFPQDLAPYGWAGYAPPDADVPVDIWLCPGQFYDAAAVAGLRAHGSRAWLAIDRPPFTGSTSIHARPADTRILAWQTVALEANALHLGRANAWPAATAQPTTPADCLAAGYSPLLYPGAAFGLSAPVASVRLKRLRQAQQDAAYLALLDRPGLEHIRLTLLHSLSPYAGSAAYRTHFADGRRPAWPSDPQLFELARRIMGEALVEALTAPVGEQPTESFTHQTSWRRLMLATRRPALITDGLRVRLRGTRQTRTADVDCAVTLLNRTRLPLAGTLALHGCPEAWDLDPLERPIEAVAPASARRALLSAVAPTMPTTAAGHLPLRVAWSVEGTDPVVGDARLAYLAALPTEHPPRIDGDLSDWPAGRVNVAGDFLLISDNGDQPPTPRNRRPQAGTHAQVLCDRHNLYIAITCFEPTARWTRRSATGRHKALRYDDLIPVGENLVEVLIDPINAGTRSPADLYRIAVKRAGFDVTTRGIQLDPPCGAWSPWAADLDVASRVEDDRWCAELRIPLAELGAAAQPPAIWGFNLTRFDAEHQEFSTWSGALRNAYDPLTLGNLYLP